MTKELHEIRDPYVVETVSVDNGEVIVVMAVDELWIDPDTSEMEVLSRLIERGEI